MALTGMALTGHDRPGQDMTSPPPSSRQDRTDQFIGHVTACLGRWSRGYALTLGLIALILTGAGCSSHAAMGASVDEVQKLETAFPLLKSKGVLAFRDQSWCRNLQYDRGAFSKTDDPSSTTCNLFNAIFVAEFGGQATLDFEQIEAAFQAMGLSPLYFNMDYDHDGMPSRATFRFDGGAYQFGRHGVWSNDESSAAVPVTTSWRWSSDP